MSGLYGGAFGRNNSVTATYGTAIGFANTVSAIGGFGVGVSNVIADDYGAAVGSFSEYTTGQTNDVLFQVGIGASGARSNGFAVRKNGVLEAKNLPTFASNATALAGGLIVGQIYKTATGELRIVV